MNNFPSLVGIQRARIEDFNWATATFTWAFGELRRLENLVTARPNDCPLRDEVADTADAILEQLENWDPSNGPH